MNWYFRLKWICKPRGKRLTKPLLSHQKKSYLFLFVPNGFQFVQVESVFSQYASECDGLVAMIQVCLEIGYKNWAECLLQIDAFVLVSQFVDVHVNRVHESLNQISGDIFIAIFGGCSKQTYKKKFKVDIRKRKEKSPNLNNYLLRNVRLLRKRF